MSDEAKGWMAWLGAIVWIGAMATDHESHPVGYHAFHTFTELARRVP